MAEPSEHIRISASATSPERQGNTSLHSRSRSRSRSRSGSHGRNPSPTDILLCPVSPNSGLPIDRRLSTASTALRRRCPTFTVTSSKYVTLIPGSEPGLNPEDPRVDLHTYCGITVVDFSDEKILQTELDNDTLKDFLQQERPAWSRVRWINLDGLSWDCISAIAKKYNLHRLAIEDLLNTKNRTKCDWYSDHAFINLAMMKLVHSSDEKLQETTLGRPPSFLQRVFGQQKEKDPELTPMPRVFSVGSNGTKYERCYTSLQSYYAGSASVERVKFMEGHTTLAEKKMLVSVEQVSIFLTADNTVISFFENSADDVEPPILERLGSQHTVLRSSCDATMIVQSIIDAVIDLSFPVVHAYQDTMADLEVSIITDPDIQHTKALYILTSELSLLKQTLSPVTGLINSLRGHKVDPSRRTPSGLCYGVEISETGKTYLADVEDHCFMLMERLDTMKRGADNMIDLIFNTIGSSQNESMKKLTLVTILFLPLTFLTGYFGMNFDRMPSVQTHHESYFWQIAVPVASATALWLLGKMLLRKLGIKVTERIWKKQKEKRRKLEENSRVVRRDSFKHG